ncbi:pleckstrin homology domain-containing family A member 7 isoform X2, partial [Tachysurus ichikawai]
MGVRADTERESRRTGPLGRGGTGSSVSMSICCGCLPPQDVNQDREEVPVHLEAIIEEADESSIVEERSHQGMLPSLFDIPGLFHSRFISPAFTCSTPETGSRGPHSRKSSVSSLSVSLSVPLGGGEGADEVRVARLVNLALDICRKKKQRDPHTFQEYIRTCSRQNWYARLCGALWMVDVVDEQKLDVGREDSEQHQKKAGVWSLQLGFFTS